MQNSLFLLCPTDYLEPIINDTFGYKNYFYESLGNSFVYDNETLNYIKQFIEIHNIQEIQFVLSKDNQIVLDALGNRDFSNIGALNNFYIEIEKQKECSNKINKNSNIQFTVLSYYLNKKIKELKLQLSNKSIKIKGKIYNKDIGRFTNIYSDLICLETYHFN
ncbi:hypothetical protein SCB49_13110 [unidentified eubacterium SCB49]|nr:hypothetical protein SCB49_13110 [unidentified eubacterium SCB49]